MPISKTLEKQIEKAVKEQVYTYMKRHNFTKIGAINQTIKQYETAIKDPKGWTGQKRKQFIMEYKKGIQIAKRLKKDKKFQPKK